MVDTAASVARAFADFCMARVPELHLDLLLQAGQGLGGVEIIEVVGSPRTSPG
ncbi:hypothetical protein ABZ297_44990 [Nonomuraea sp. NPDC005983]|uniref:hypothetical protein n=1 Tax=Nonomuraea sp. NPDC005983 TaxID=3155595 RepID=UPI0033A98FBF